MDEKVYLVKDLAGCVVVTTKGETLGKLLDVLPTGANDVYVVGEGKEEILIPALKSVVKKIDLENKRIEVELPVGLARGPDGKAREA